MPARLFAKQMKDQGTPWSNLDSQDTSSSFSEEPFGLDKNHHEKGLMQENKPL
jgi:hypothetical protein